MSFTPELRLRSALLFAALVVLGAPSLRAQAGVRFPGRQLSIPAAMDLKAADLDQDTHVDLIALSLHAPAHLALLFGDGRGEFSAPIEPTPAPVRWSVAVGDVDGDQDLDLVVGSTGAVLVLYGDGSGAFPSSASFSLQGDDIYGDLRLGDLDLDGDLDLVVVTDASISVLFGDGAGAFGAPILHLPGGDVRAFELGDLNHDGDLDLVCLVGTPKNQIAILANDSHGAFAPPLVHAVPVNSTDLELADVDADGNLDVLTSFGGIQPTRTQLWRGDGAGDVVSPPVDTGVPIVAGLTVADLDQDGTLDLLGGGNSAALLARGLGGGAFAPASAFPAGEYAQATLAADFNEDGTADFAACNNVDTGVTLYLSHCGGGYPVAPPHPTGVVASPNSEAPFALGDVDEDGWPDLVTSGDVAAHAFLHRGDGAGGFGAPTPVALPFAASYVALGDVTGDGHVDLVFKWQGVSSVSLMTGDGSGVFALHSSYATQIQGRALELDDWNADGRADLAVANSGAYSVSIRMSTGASGFGPPVEFPLGAQRRALSLASGDVDGDGNRDLVIGYRDNLVVSFRGVAVMRGDGSGGFTLSLNEPLGEGTSVACGDFDADGRDDVALVVEHDLRLGVLLAGANGVLQLHAWYPIPLTPTGVSVGDIDGDGRLDAVTTDRYQQLRVWLGDGSGALANPLAFACDGCDQASIVAVADLDRDGRSDVISSSGVHDVLTVLSQHSSPGEARSYCTAQANSLGCTPAIVTAGYASATSSAPFLVGAQNVLNQKAGGLFYGFAAWNAPFQGGTKCVASPVHRTPPQSSGGSSSGSDCSGAFSFDFNAHLQSGLDPLLVVGEEVFAQYWSRDPASPSTINLTDAVRFTICR